MITTGVVLVVIVRSTNVKNLQVALEERMHQRLKVVAANTGETLANLIRQAVGEFVESHERTQPAANGEGH